MNTKPIILGISLSISLLTGGCSTTTPANSFTVKWVNYDDTVLEEDKNVAKGDTPQYDGETPQRDDSGNFTYVFTGWSPELAPVTEDITYVAQFDSVQKSFTVTWKNYDGTPLEEDTGVQRNEMPHYDGAVPNKPSTEQYTYTFDGWDKALAPVTQDVTYTAKFIQTANQYTVTWKNGETVIDTDEFGYGTIPEYTGSDPTKPSTQTQSFTFSGWSLEEEGEVLNPLPAITGDVIYYAQFESSTRLYTIKFYDYDGDVVVDSQQLEYNSSIVGPSGTYKTFYNILGYNAKTNTGDWDDTLLTELPNATDDADYRLVTQLKNDTKYLLNDLSTSSSVLGSTWDYEYGGSLSKEAVASVPTGASLSTQAESVRVSTKNGTVTINIGNDFFNAIDDFNNTDYIQLLAKFPVYASGSKYNDVGLLLCKSGPYGLNRSQPTDNTGTAVYYNGATYWVKQTVSNGDWQQFRIYVSEIKEMLAGVPESNKTEWDSIVINGIKDAANPADSSNKREMTIYDVEFHHIDITQDFVINECTNVAQARGAENTTKDPSNYNDVALYDTTVPYVFNNVNYLPGKPTGTVKTGDMAINITSHTGDFRVEFGLDISFIVDNLDAFDDDDVIVAYVWGFNNYWSYYAKGAAKETYVAGGGVDLSTRGTDYTKSFSASHRIWLPVSITIGEIKALQPISSANCSTNYTHGDYCKSNWLVGYMNSAMGGTPNLIYSVELHHAS